MEWLLIPAALLLFFIWLNQRGMEEKIDRVLEELEEMNNPREARRQMHDMIH